MPKSLLRAGKQIAADSLNSGNDNNILLSSEMYLTGYPIDDLLHHPDFKTDIAKACEQLIQAFAAPNMPKLILGAPYFDNVGYAEQKSNFTQHIRHYRGAYNSLLLITNGICTPLYHKSILANDNVFDDARIFSPNHQHGAIYQIADSKIGLLICEDGWAAQSFENLRALGADFCCIVNGSPFYQGKQQKRVALMAEFAKQYHMPIIYLNMVGGKDHLVFDGASFALDADGKVILQMPSFREALGRVSIKNTHEISGKIIAKHLPEIIIADSHYVEHEDARLHDLYHAACLGMGDYIRKNGFEHVVLGLSGGIDSALTAAMASDILGKERVIALMMPSQFTSEQSLTDAEQCAENLGIEYHCIVIEPILSALTDALAPLLGVLDSGITHENLQARIRGMLLMAHSNQRGSFLLSTSNKSESACGYATLYGDMCGGYAPLQDIYKSDIFKLARWRNRFIPSDSLLPITQIIPENIITKPPSAELRLNQRDADSLPPYEILDQILYRLIEGEQSFKSQKNDSLDGKIWQMVQNSEYKRAQATVGTNLSKRSLGYGRRYPINHAFKK